MPPSGLFITLFDKETLKLYLSKGIYGFHMAPVLGEVSSRSKHYAALADYACARKGTQVFFFLEREIIYGGSIAGSKKYGAFWLNGPYSPMGRKADSSVCWDESNRHIYQSTGVPGIFQRNDGEKKCQPYLLRFKRGKLSGNVIKSDQLYFELDKFLYPLPSNSIAGMSFCTLTPAETKIALKLLKNEPVNHYEAKTDEDVELVGEPISFKPEYGISSLSEATSESHLEASVIANPDLLVDEMRPKNATVCRQVPISPLKPLNMIDRADICYYHRKDAICEGTIPNTIIELKAKKAGKNECEQVQRYLRWLHKRLRGEAERIELYLLAPSFARTVSVEPEFREQIHLVRFEECDESSRQTSL